jgi:hypothetical protein
MARPKATAARLLAEHFHDPAYHAAGPCDAAICGVALPDIPCVLVAGHRGAHVYVADPMADNTAVTARLVAIERAARAYRDACRGLGEATVRQARAWLFLILEASDGQP